jgi:4-hydroxy-3-methylbut-2-enyl diphosphate reductase
MGQYDASNGGSIHLVESPADVERLAIRDPERLAFVTQTTLSVDDTSAVIDALRRRFPAIVGPRKDDICYATQNRQDAVKTLSEHCDLMLVVGSPNSSNSNRLREIAEKRGIEAHLIDGTHQIDDIWLNGKRSIGVTAGASAPEVLVREVVDYLKGRGIEAVTEFAGRPEKVTFSLPAALREKA